MALGVLGVSDVLGAPPSALPAGFDPTAASLKGFLFAQLVIGMLGALAVTSEYGTGTIATSLAVVPARSRLLGAKTVVVAGVAAVTAAFTTGLSFTVAQLLLYGAGLPAVGPGTPGVLGALAAATLYLTLVALVGVAVGVLTRSSTSSLAVLVGALLLVPALAPGLPGAVGDVFARYWPITAGQAAYVVVPVDGQVAPGLGLLILAAAVAAVTTAGHHVLRTRDVRSPAGREGQQERVEPQAMGLTADKCSALARISGRRARRRRRRRDRGRPRSAAAGRAPEPRGFRPRRAARTAGIGTVAVHAIIGASCSR